MTLTTLAAGLSWYDKLVEKIPEGQLFSWRAVFDAIPSLIERLPTTLGLTIAGAIFGLLLALLFAIVKINRTKVLYPIQAVFVSFLRGTPILVQLMLTYYGIPLFLKFLKIRYGFDWNINAIPASVFAVTAFAFNEAAYTSETIRAAIQAVNQRRRCNDSCIWNNYATVNLKGGSDYRYFERYISVALVYWVISIIIEQIGRLIEKRMDIDTPQSSQKEVTGDIR